MCSNDDASNVLTCKRNLNKRPRSEVRDGLLPMNARGFVQKTTQTSTINQKSSEAYR